jgi:hypothetical protein
MFRVIAGIKRALFGLNPIQSYLEKPRVPGNR